MVDPERIKEMRLVIQEQALKDIPTREIRSGLVETFGVEANFITSELIEKISKQTIAEAREWFKAEREQQRRNEQMEKLADKLELMVANLEALPDLLVKKLNNRLEQFTLTAEREEREEWEKLVRPIPSILIYMPNEFLDGFSLSTTDEFNQQDHHNGGQAEKDKNKGKRDPSCSGEYL